MDKAKLDTLYYLLREVSNEASSQQSSELADVVYRLAGHLLAGTNYLGLVRYSRYYGEQFLLQPTYEAICKKDWSPTRFVEFGAALGWLCRGLASKFKIKDVLTIDKRAWTAIDLVADLETAQGIKSVQEVMKDGDVIVAADLLHCLKNPREVMLNFLKWPIVALEYCSADTDYMESYTTQIARYGADPIMPETFGEMFPGRRVDAVDLEPYILLLVDGP